VDKTLPSMDTASVLQTSLLRLQDSLAISPSTKTSLFHASSNLPLLHLKQMYLRLVPMDCILNSTMRPAPLIGPTGIMTATLRHCSLSLKCQLTRTITLAIKSRAGSWLQLLLATDSTCIAMTVVSSIWA
jgi:hypothetical protein